MLCINKKTDVLIVVDVQNDFLENGVLSINDSNQIISVINRLMTYFFDWSVATQDWHPKDHKSFICNQTNRKKYDDFDFNYRSPMLWPRHAVQNTAGAEFPKELKQEYFKLIVRKGWRKDMDSYSAFYENDRKTSTGLLGWMHEINCKRIFFTGLAENYCVAYSAIDAVKAGFITYIISDATKPIENTLKNSHSEAISRQHLQDLGVIYISSMDITL